MKELTVAPSLRRRGYVPPVARGEAFAAHASTEPGAGSDVAGIGSGNLHRWPWPGRATIPRRAQRSRGAGGNAAAGNAAAWPVEEI
ncbi:MAG: hypothetical protein ACP5G6_05475 [Conexivisphaera sp.]